MESVDWFGILLDDDDRSKKCIFCEDKNINPYEDPHSWANSHKTTPCRHLICGVCEENRPISHGMKCPLCGTKISQNQLKNKDPKFLALEDLNNVREEIYRVWNLDSTNDFNNNIAKYNSFLEEREDIVNFYLKLKLANQEEQKALISEFRAKSEAFKKQHREAINRANERIKHEKEGILAKIQASERAKELLEKKVKEEKEEEERVRLERKLQRNEENLGVKYDGKNENTQEENKEKNIQRQVYYVYAKSDHLKGPVPRRVESYVHLACLDSKLMIQAGGFDERDYRKRLQQEMLAGWDVL